MNEENVNEENVNEENVNEEDVHANKEPAQRKEKGANKGKKEGKQTPDPTNVNEENVNEENVNEENVHANKEPVQSKENETKEGTNKETHTPDPTNVKGENVNEEDMKEEEVNEETSAGNSNMFTIQHMKTIQDIDKVLEKEYKDHLNSDVTVTGDLPADFPISAQRLHASPNENDCLIHSFLTVISPTFRKLAKKTKDTVASQFRTTVYQEIANERLKGTPKTKATQRIQGGELLDDTDVTNLTEYYNIPLLVLEDKKTSHVEHFDKGKHGSKRVLTTPMSMKACVQLYNGSTDTSAKVYLIYNKGNYHFEPVRIDAKHYTIDHDVATWLTEQMGCAKPSEITSPTDCKHQFGDKVLYKGHTYRILSRTFQEDTTKCLHYNLATETQFHDFQKVPSSTQSTIDAHSTHKNIPEKDLDPVAKHGGTRKLRTIVRPMGISNRHFLSRRRRNCAEI